MSSLTRVPLPVRVVLVAAGYAALWLQRARFDPWALQAGVVVLGYGFLLWTSGPVVDRVLWPASSEKWPSRPEDDEPDGAAPDGGDPAASESGRPVTRTVDEHDASRAEDASGDGDPDGAVTQQERDVGTIVGKAENVLLLTFILVEAYTALSLVVAARGVIRREAIQKNPRYYLAGMLTNVTYSVVVGVLILVALRAFGVGGVGLFGPN